MVVGGRTHHLHHDGHILELLGPTFKSSQVVFHRLRALLRGSGGLCSDLSDSYQSLADSVLGSASGGSSAPYSRLATGAGKSGDAIGRLEGTLSLAGGGGGGGVPCIAQGSIISYSNLLHGHIQDSSGGPSPAGVGYAGFLLARLLKRRVLRGGACRMGDCVLAGFPRWFGGPAFSASQHGPPDQVGGSTDAPVWRYDSGDTS